MQNEIHPAPGRFSAAQLATDPILQFFHYVHLPNQLQITSRHFCDLAEFIIRTLPRNPERTVALRKLLEAKDAAVRANLPAPEILNAKPVTEIGDLEPPIPVETGGFNEDKDGPLSFNG